MNRILPVLPFQSRRSLSITLFIIIATVQGLHAQSWGYDFGSQTSLFDQQGSSTGFLPAPPNGSAFVSIGSGGGSFTLDNPGTSLGSASELAQAPSGSNSVNKFGIYNYTPGK